jgi:hypothetical protein
MESLWVPFLEHVYQALPSFYQMFQIRPSVDGDVQYRVLQPGSLGERPLGVASSCLSRRFCDVVAVGTCTAPRSVYYPTSGPRGATKARAVQLTIVTQRANINGEAGCHSDRSQDLTFVVHVFLVDRGRQA